ncbi:MAG: PorV/PorQ family protein [Bacteroidetes bacterium]|nr:PorV/PorQ family protein [Bacteroidota bacterium]MBU2586156.1 PorV/PorQ family protein [Bacteroidota bacterium]
MQRVILILLICFTNATFGQEFKKTATSGFVFLEIPVTARTAALGEASIALSDVNCDALFNNPAALGFTNQLHSFSVSYAPYIAEIKHYATSYAFNSPYGVFGVGVIIMDYGDMPKTQKVTGQRVYEVIGSFRPQALSVGLSYSKMLTDRFSFGITTKYVREKIDIYSVDNFLFDGGILYYTGLGSLRIAANIQNFGVDAQYINDPFKMPAMLRLGAAAEVIGEYNSDFRVTTIAEAIHLSDSDERVSAGVECAWKDFLTIRAGYKFFYDEETYSVGLGLNPKMYLPIAFDLAYSSYGRLGNVLRLTLQVGLL